MGATVKIAILADAGKAASEFDKVSQAAGDMGNATEKSSGGMGAALDKMGGAAFATANVMDTLGGSLDALDQIQNAGRNRANALARAQADVEQAMLDGEQAAADLKQATNDLRQAQIDGAQAGVDLKQAQIDQKQAMLDVKTAQKAYTAAIREHGRTSAEAQQAAIDLGQAHTDLAQAGVDVKQAQEDARQATADGTQAQLDAKQAAIDSKTAAVDLNEATAAANPTPVQQMSQAFSALTPLVGLAMVAVQGATVAQTGLNLAFLSSPITWIVVGIAALVAGLVIAYQKSTTFRRIVNGAFGAVWGAIKTGWTWVRQNWPLLLAIITGPIGLATRFVVTHWGQITAGVRAIPGKIRGAFASAGSWLRSAGSNIVRGIWSGINGMSSWLYNTLIGWAKRIIPGPIAKALGIASPSKVMRDLARWVPRGAALGIEDETAAVRRAATGMAVAAVPYAPRAAAPAGGSWPAGGTLTLRPGSGSTSSAGQLIVALLREELRKGGGLQAVLA